MDEIIDRLIALTPIPKKWAWLFQFLIGIVGDVSYNYVSSYFVFYVVYPSTQYTFDIYTSINVLVKLLLLVGLISLYFFAVPQPWEKLYWLYEKFRAIDGRVKEVVRDGFCTFLISAIALRFLSVPMARIPWEVYKWLAVQREWEVLPPTATQFQYDPIHFKFEGPIVQLTAESSTIKSTEIVHFTPSNIKPPKDYLVIRLLELSQWYPGRGIHARLIEAHLDNLPDYEAISYTWGDPSKTRIIVLNGFPFAVTSTVYSILEDRCSIQGRKLLWIDSICINQDDLQEKSQQVQLMRDVYRGAKQVTVWLGDAPDAHLALYLIYKIVMMRYVWKLPEETLHDIYRRDGTRRTPPWLALGKLINNPYWDRVWIIQEYASASKIEVLYGRRPISWTMLRGVMIVFTNIHMAPLLAPTENVFTQRKLPLDKLSHALALERFQESVQQNLPLSLTEVLTFSNGFKATNPRDMVFALTGITDDPVHPLIAPDYEKSIRVVFRDATRFILSKKGSENPLFFLSYAGVGHPRLEQDLPSWVPDWSKPVQPLTIGFRSPNYSASGNSSPKFSPSLDADMIIIGGLIVDEISELSPYDDENLAEVENFKFSDVFKGTRRYKVAQNLLTKCLGGPYVNGQPLSEAFWRAAIGDASTNERPALKIYKEYFDCFEEIFGQEQDSSLERFVQKFENVDNISDIPDITDLEDRFREWGSSEESLEKIAKSTKFTAMANNISVSRRFCITKKRYIGWVPRLTQVGDLVSIIDGEPTPYIVRRCERSTAHLGSIASAGITRFLESCWTPRSTCCVDSDNLSQKMEMSQFLLVGACYMHAMMDGEMLELGIRQPFIFR